MKAEEAIELWRKEGLSEREIKLRKFVVWLANCCFASVQQCDIALNPYSDLGNLDTVPIRQGQVAGKVGADHNYTPTRAKLMAVPWSK